VEIYRGTLGNGGGLLTHAFFAQSRPDVAGTFGRADWDASGWAAILPTNALPPGNNLVSVYVPSLAKGWWYKQISVAVSPSATTRAAPPAQGFDISFPQCRAPEPTAPAFAVVGVNGGRAFSANPCLARQYVWALTSVSPVQPRVAFYMNTGNPGPDASPRWPTSGTTTPQPCDGLAADWEQIVGATAANAPFAALPNWRPGPRSGAEALSWCSRSVTGGKVLFVQYPAGVFDGNLPCP
jgi:hypothetical protein